jgi:hypothetical protein
MPAEVVADPKTAFERWGGRFFQGASPGLSIGNLQSDAEIRLRHLFPERPEQRLRLPGMAPKVTIEISATDRRRTQTFLNAVVVLPDQQRVVLVWSARAEVSRPYIAPQLANMRWTAV